MADTLKLTILILGLVFNLAVFMLLVTRRINERSSLPWIAGSFVIMLFSFMPSLLEIMANYLGVDYPPALLFLITILIILLLLLYQAIHISVLQNKCQELAQNLAIISSMSNIKLQSCVIEREETDECTFLIGTAEGRPAHL